MKNMSMWAYFSALNSKRKYIHISTPLALYGNTAILVRHRGIVECILEHRFHLMQKTEKEGTKNYGKES
jgi:hypothetical protein